QQVVVQITNNPSVGGARAFLAGVQIKKLPQRLYVNGAAADGGNGWSWGAAINDLRQAMADVSLYGGAVKEVWVAKGTYDPAVVSFRGDTFNLPSGVRFYGGFSGGETSLSQRDIIGNRVFLTGSIGAAGIADNSFHVVTAVNCGSG